MNSLQKIIERHIAGECLKFVHFWGHRPSKDSSITKSCFSQWFEVPFTVDGAIYSTAEHYMMAAKARLFNDSVALDKVLTAASPGAAKAAGREVIGFNQTVWEANRERIVYEANLAKFGQNPVLKAFLLGTGDSVLVEASPVDAVWGVGLSATDANIDNPTFWQGLNLLGFALMDVRNTLQTAN